MMLILKKEAECLQSGKYRTVLLNTDNRFLQEIVRHLVWRHFLLVRTGVMNATCIFWVKVKDAANHSTILCKAKGHSFQTVISAQLGNFRWGKGAYIKKNWFNKHVSSKYWDTNMATWSSFTYTALSAESHSANKRQECKCLLREILLAWEKDT